MGLLLFAPLTVGAEPASSEGSAEQDARWIPGVALFSGGFVQDRTASVDSDTRGFSGGENTAFMWSVGISAELSTPVLLPDIPGRPRLFVHGDIGALLNQEDPVANEGDPGGQPTPVADPITGVSPVGAVTNRGSATRVQTEPLLLAAGAGVVFQTTAWDRAVRIKPSVEWLWQEDRVQVLLGDAESEGLDPLLCDPICRTISVDATTTQGFHSLGPAVEIEVDAARAQDFLFTLFLSAGAYHVLGDREVDLSVTAAWERADGLPTARPDPTSTVDSFYEREPWHYRFGIGLRVLWVPE